MTQATPKDDESFTNAIHSSSMRDEGPYKTLFVYFKPLVCLAVCLEVSTVITLVIYDLINSTGVTALLQNNKSQQDLHCSLP